MIQQFLALMVCLGVMHSMVAQPANAVAPWEITDEQRIRERSDHARAAERMRQATHAAGSGRAPQLRGDIIDGRFHPELFLPEELFSIMLNGAFSEDVKGRTIYRNARVADMKRLGLSEQFWAELEPSVADYLTTLRRARALNRDAAATEDAFVAGALRIESNAIQAGQCGRIVDGLERARRKFGRLVIDRFLYESVARTAVTNLSRPTTAEQLRSIKRGCR